MTLQQEYASNQLVDDRYVVIRGLGSGANGTVYVATDKELDRPVAIKVLHAHSLNGWSEEPKQRFFREAKALSQLTHKHIITVHRFGLLKSGQPYIVMEYLEGETLWQEIERQGSLTCSQATERCLQVAQALTHAHSQGIIHRDVKPENIFVQHSGDTITVRLFDFGLSTLKAGSENKEHLTRTGSLLGTPMYVSPEQFRGEQADPRSDIYALGCVFFEMLAGRPPFQTEDIAVAMWKHLNQPLPNLLKLDPDAGLPAQVHQILSKSLAKDRDQRYQSTQPLIEDLEALLAKNSQARFNPAMLQETTVDEIRSNPAIAPDMVLPLLLGSLAAVILCLTAAVTIALMTPSLFADLTGKLMNPAQTSAVLTNTAGTILRVQGPVRAEWFCQQTFESSAYRSWDESDRLNLDSGYYRLLETDTEVDRLWPIMVETLNQRLKCVRAHVRPSAVADKTSDDVAARLAASKLSKAKWIVLTRMLDFDYHGLLGINHNENLPSSASLMALHETASAHTPDYKGVVFHRRGKIAFNSIESAKACVQDSNSTQFNESINTAWKLAKQTNDEPDMIRIHHVLADRYIFLNQRQQALEEFQKADSIDRKFYDEWTVADHNRLQRELQIQGGAR